MAIIDKKTVGRNFGRFAKSYEQAGRLQRRVAEELVSQSAEFKGRILDLGSGTGAVKEISGWEDVVEVDISYGMCAESGGVCVNADIESLPFADGSFNNAIASLSLQWVDMEKALAEAARVLKPGGRLAFSTFSPNSLKNLRDAFAYIDSQQHLMEFEHAIRLFAMLKKAGFDDVAMSSQNISYAYDGLLPALRSIKDIGAAYNFAPGVGKGLKTRNYFQRVENAYRAITKAEGKVTLEWEVLYISARKPH